MSVHYLEFKKSRGTTDTRPLTAEIRALPVSRMPSRLANSCAVAGMRTIGEAADRDLTRVRSVGERFLRDLPLFLEELRNDPLARTERWRDLIDTAWPRLRENERTIVDLRAALHGRHATSAEIARQLDLSPSRIAQLEAKAIARMDVLGAWTMLARERLERLVQLAVLRGGDIGLRDPFLAVRPGEERAFEFFVNRILRGRLTAVHEHDDVVISRFSRTELRERRVVLKLDKT